MKKALLTLVFAAISVTAGHAQGTISFANGTLTRVQWYDSTTGALVDVPLGAPIVYGVFWGSSADSLTLNEGPLGTASTISAGLITAAYPYPIVGGEPGETYFMRIAGWTSTFGRDAAAAKSSPGAHYAETGVRQFQLAPTQGPGTVIWSTSNTALFHPLRFTIPEPSVVSLGVLGVGGLFLHRRIRRRN